MKKTVLIVILAAAVLMGCSLTRGPVQTQPRTVTQITADYRSGVIELHRQYTDADKMRAVLNYLRCLTPSGIPDEDPTSVAGSVVQIVLTYSDGSTKTYRQRADQYLQIEDGAWQSIPSEKGREFPLLLGLMESD